MKRRQTDLDGLEFAVRLAHRDRPAQQLPAEWVQQTMQRIRKRAPVRPANRSLRNAQRFAWRFAACTGLTSLAAACYALIAWGGPEQFLLQLTMSDFEIWPVLTILGGLVS